ncbi:unnamed protein product [Durusdinium trenchii]|uniref:Fungal lipase-type domain-containing protein n=1 Tax=Durusdinium trenchii TaxID=1381693 RepID=A0ABP0L4B6_9DINO
MLRVAWRYDDHWSGGLAAWRSGSQLRYLGLRHLSRDLHRPDGERSLVMQVELDRQKVMKLGPVQLKHAMALLLANFMEPFDLPLHRSLKDLETAVTLARHGQLAFEPEGWLKGHANEVVIVRLKDEHEHELYALEQIAKEVLKQLKLLASQNSLAAAGFKVMSVDRKLRGTLVSQVDSELLLVKWEEEEELRAMEQSEVMTVRPVPCSFGAELMKPERRHECLQYLHMAQEAYDSQLATPTTWELCVDGFRSLSRCCRRGRRLEVWLACRGTSNVREAVADFKFGLITCRNGLTGRVHRGFWEAFEALWPRLLKKLEEIKEADDEVLFHITGHSLGAALATLLAVKLAQTFGEPGRASPVTCVTWGSPQVGDEAFRTHYLAWVPHTARFVNKWDLVPWLPSPTGWLDGLLGEDERQGVLYMKSVYQLWREIQQGAAVEEYVHVVEATQLETSVFERFSWAASHLLTACAYHQSGEHWRMSFPSLSKALEEALAPHLLSAYEANLENIDGIDGPEKLIFELLKNFGALKAQLWKLKEQFAPPSTALSDPSIARMVAPAMPLSLPVVNLVTSLVSTAGTWYGLWRVKQELGDLGQRQKADSMRLQQLVEQLDRLPDDLMQRIQINEIRKKVKKLKDLAVLLEEEADLSQARLDQRLDQRLGFIADIRKAAKYLQDLIRPECQWLAWQVLEAICTGYRMELEMHRTGDPKSLPVRARQIWDTLEGPVLELAWHCVRRPGQLRDLAPSWCRLAVELQDAREAAPMDVDALAVRVVKALRSEVPAAAQEWFRQVLPDLPMRGSSPRAVDFLFGLWCRGSSCGMVTWEHLQVANQIASDYPLSPNDEQLLVSLMAERQEQCAVQAELANGPMGGHGMFSDAPDCAMHPGCSGVFVWVFGPLATRDARPARRPIRKSQELSSMDWQVVLKTEMGSPDTFLQELEVPEGHDPISDSHRSRAAQQFAKLQAQAGQDASFRELIEKLPADLNCLRLEFPGTWTLSDGSLLELARVLARNTELVELKLNFQGHLNLEAKTINQLSRRMPKKLRCLSWAFEHSRTDAQKDGNGDYGPLFHLARSWPPTVTELSLHFRSKGAIRNEVIDEVRNHTTRLTSVLATSSSGRGPLVSGGTQELVILTTSHMGDA